MRIFGLTISILLLFISIGCTPTKSTSLRVMTWNIWHGGIHGTQASDFAEDTARNPLNVVKVLAESPSDVLLMQETYCCGMDIAKEAGYPYSWRGSSNLSIHSRYPIIDTIHLFKPFNSHAAVIEVAGTPILFVNLWLHYLPNYFQDVKTYSPDSLIAGESATRLAEISAITKTIDSLQEQLDMPVIVGGDFNSGSHLDWIESTRGAHYGKVVEWPVSKLMLERGFTDSFREANPDPTTTLDGTWGFLGDEIISDRIDYIYYRSDILQTQSSQIVMDDPPGGFFNSDHRAILSIFSIKK